MTDVAKAIQALNEDNNNSHEFVISGEPSNETEYQRDVKYVSGADENSRPSSLLRLLMGKQKINLQQTKRGTRRRDSQDGMTSWS